MSLITAASFSAEIVKMAKTAKMVADLRDEAFLARADSRAIQGGAIDDEASHWHQLSRTLFAAAREAAKIEG